MELFLCLCAGLTQGTQTTGIFLLASFPGLPRLLFFGLLSYVILKNKKWERPGNEAIFLLYKPIV